MLRRYLLPMFLTGIVICGIVSLAAQQTPTDARPLNFPLSVWETQKDVTQIPWSPLIGKPSVRSDLQQELRIGAFVRDSLSGENKDLVLFARVSERGNVVAPLRSSKTSLIAIVRPGKYRVEMALVDPAGRYSTHFEDVVVQGKEDAPLEQAFGAFGKFEFVNEREQEPTPRPALPDLQAMASILRGGIIRPVVLTGSNMGLSAVQPTFAVGRASPMHLSVYTILEPPENPALGEAFQQNLTNILSVLARLDIPSGTAQLTGVDLTARTRVFDRVNLKDFTPGLLSDALKKDTTTVSLEALAARAERGTFFRNVLQQRLGEAENDNSGAQHAIVIVSAQSRFTDVPRLTIPRTRECHCKVFYFRFALVPNEGDDIDDIVKDYRPRIYTPLTWKEFREDFGAMYAELLR